MTGNIMNTAISNNSNAAVTRLGRKQDVSSTLASENRS